MTKHIIGGLIATGGSRSQEATGGKWTVKKPNASSVYLYEFYSRGQGPKPMLGLRTNVPGDPHHSHAEIDGIKVAFAFSHDLNEGRVYLDLPVRKMGPDTENTPVGGGDTSTLTLPEQGWKDLFAQLFSGQLHAKNQNDTPFLGFRVKDVVPAKITFSPDPSSIGGDGSVTTFTVTIELASNNIVPAGSPTRLTFKQPIPAPDERRLADAELGDQTWGDPDFPLQLGPDAQFTVNGSAEWAEDDH